MRKLRAIILAAAISAVLVPAGSAQATECTPKGCTGGCRGPRVEVDENGITVTPIECYS